MRKILLLLLLPLFISCYIYGHDIRNKKKILAPTLISDNDIDIAIVAGNGKIDIFPYIMDTGGLVIIEPGPNTDATYIEVYSSGLLNVDGMGAGGIVVRLRTLPGAPNVYINVRKMHTSMPSAAEYGSQVYLIYNENPSKITTQLNEVWKPHFEAENPYLVLYGAPSAINPPFVWNCKGIRYQADNITPVGADYVSSWGILTDSPVNYSFTTGGYTPNFENVTPIFSSSPLAMRWMSMIREKRMITVYGSLSGSDTYRISCEWSPDLRIWEEVEQYVVRDESYNHFADRPGYYRFVAHGNQTDISQKVYVGVEFFDTPIARVDRNELFCKFLPVGDYKVQIYDQRGVISEEQRFSIQKDQSEIALSFSSRIKVGFMCKFLSRNSSKPFLIYKTQNSWNSMIWTIKT